MAALTDVADRLGLTRGQVVLAWLTASTPAIRPILGVSSVEQLDQALVASAASISQDDLVVLDSAR